MATIDKIADLLLNNKKNLTPEEKSERDYWAKKLSTIDYFIGSLDEYALFKREKGDFMGDEIVVPMPLKGQNQYLWYLDSRFPGEIPEFREYEADYLPRLIEAVKEGCIGLVRCQITPICNSFRLWVGMPVKVKAPKVPPFR